jgi:hypothetical protein
MTAINNPKTPMEHYNMSDFLRGQASKIMTRISEDDKSRCEIFIHNRNILFMPKIISGKIEIM